MIPILFGKSRRRLSFSIFAVIAILFSAFPLILQAGTCTWIAPSGNWSDPNNWSPVGVPTATDDIVVSSGYITLDVPVTVQSLSFSGGQIQGAEPIVVENLFDWSGGTIGGLGTMQVTGIMNITGTATKFITGKSLFIFQDCYWTGGDLSMSSGVSINFEATSKLFLDHTTAQTVNGSGTMVVKGALIKSQSPISSISCVFQLDGGSATISAGTLRMSSSNGTYTGSFNLATGTVLQFNGGAHQFNNGSSITGQGSLKITNSSATVNINAGSSVDTRLEITSGAFNNNTTITLPDLIQSNGTMGGSGTTNVTDSLNWSRGTISTTGSIYSNGTFYVNGSLSKSLSSGTIEVRGLGVWVAGNISIGATGVLRVGNSASFDVAHTSTLSMGSAGAGLVEILGTMTKTANSTTNINGTFSTGGTGVLQINLGSMVTQAASSGNHYGAISIASGALLNFANGSPHHFNSGSTVAGLGTMRVSGGLVFCNSGSVVASKLEITAGTLTDSEGITPSYYMQSGGLFTGNSSPNCTGDLLWSDGTISGSGVFSVAGISTFPTGGANRTLATKTLQLNGDGVWSGGDFSFESDAVLEVNTGSTLDLSHTADAEANGTGTFSIIGTLSKNHPSANTAIIDIVTENTGRVVGTGHVSFLPLDNQGVFAPGFSPGTIYVNQFDNTTATLEVEIADISGPGIGHDQLVVTNGATLGGTLDVRLLNGFIPEIGNSFSILTANAVSGTFTTVNLPALPSDRNWVTQYQAGEVLLLVAGVLPVELVAFSAEASDKVVVLNWETATEQNNRGFEVQRSQDGLNWGTIGFRNGQGTTSDRGVYAFVDSTPQKGFNYYRLNQVDFDGKSTLSAVNMVEVMAEGEGYFATAYPNPIAGEEIHVAYLEDMKFETIYTVVDLSGKVVTQGKMGAGSRNQRFVLPFKVKQAGMYQLQLVNGNRVQLIEVWAK